MTLVGWWEGQNWLRMTWDFWGEDQLPMTWKALGEGSNTLSHTLLHVWYEDNFEPNFQGNESAPGIIPRTLAFLFQCVRKQLYPEPRFKPKYSSDVAVTDDRDVRKMNDRKRLIMELADVGVRRFCVHFLYFLQNPTFFEGFWQVLHQRVE